MLFNDRFNVFESVADVSIMIINSNTITAVKRHNIFQLLKWVGAVLLLLLLFDFKVLTGEQNNQTKLLLFHNRKLIAWNCLLLYMTEKNARAVICRICMNWRLQSWSTLNKSFISHHKLSEVLCAYKLYLIILLNIIQLIGMNKEQHI